MAYCMVMAVAYIPWDLFLKPVAVDQEVWLGVVIRGWGAKLTAPLHWVIYSLGAYGFWRMRRWMWPWASLYAAQVALGTFLWSVVYVGGLWGWLSGIVGGACVGALALALWEARERFDSPRPPLCERYGKWGLVTGASAGIGREFARALAAQGVSVVLNARRRDRLEELAREIEARFHVDTRVVPADLADPQGAEQIVSAVKDLDIGILVSNAGFGYAGRFDKQEPARLRAMVEVNCSSPVILTANLLPAMLRRGRGAVLFTGSIAGRQPVPYHGVYSATKAFDLFLGEALWAELRGSGVDVLVIEPGPTRTEFQAAAGELEHPGEPPERVVEVALDALGQQPSVISGWFNWLRVSLERALPRSVVVLLAGSVMSSYTRPEMR